VAVGFDEFDVDKERERLRKLSDRELIREVARYMRSPATKFRKPPRDEFVIELRLCQEEWRRRHPKVNDE
jgi:hypothetical protein